MRRPPIERGLRAIEVCVWYRRAVSVRGASGNNAEFKGGSCAGGFVRVRWRCLGCCRVEDSVRS